MATKTKPSDAQTIHGSVENSGIALLVVDMQQDFVLPSSPHCVAGAISTIPALMILLDQARQREWSIFHIIRNHRADGGDAEPFRQHYFANGQGACVAGTQGAEIIAELAPHPGESVVIKQRFSGFYETSLEAELRQKGIHTVVITGTQYPNCIRGTAMDALYRNYRVIVVTDACSAKDAAIATYNISDMRGMGILCVPSPRLMKILEIQD